jgi:FeS assembly SUF system regulator
MQKITMLRITRETDYGIVLMTTLVQHEGDQTFSASMLAKYCQLPIPMVSKILKILTQAGLLISQRGAHGGYTLARPAQLISVAEVIEALEGPIAITECSTDEPQACAHQGHCRVSDPWNQINEAIRAALQNINLAEMSQRRMSPRQPAPLSAVTTAKITDSRIMTS